jgi:hypothetical protein
MEAQHAAGKINGWLKRLSTTQALLLAGLYTERPWSDEVTKALPFGLAGAAEAYPTVRVEWLRAVARGQTRARSVAAWVEDVVHKGRRDLVNAWRAQLELACALAVHAYDRATTVPTRTRQTRSPHRGCRPCQSIVSPIATASRSKCGPSTLLRPGARPHRQREREPPAAPASRQRRDVHIRWVGALRAPHGDSAEDPPLWDCICLAAQTRARRK